MTTQDSRSATLAPAPIISTPAGPGSPSGQGNPGTQAQRAAEGSASPSAKPTTLPMHGSPAGNTATPPAKSLPTPNAPALEGNQTSQDQSATVTHSARVLAENLPGGQAHTSTQIRNAAGDKSPVPAILLTTPSDDSPVQDTAPPAAIFPPAPNGAAPLADPFLALAADILDDLEKVRIANENRLRQLTRSETDVDKDGRNDRGFGLDETHPDVARLAALVGMLAGAEHQATLNLQRVIRKHPLGPWMAARKGIGEKQGARLLAAIGDPYIRPEIEREDGTVEPSRPRTVSELRQYCGYGEDPARPGQIQQRRKREVAKWSSAAKMRTYLIAEKCVQSGKASNTPYYQLYTATKAKYADATHATECARCGPKGKPAQPGSPLSNGHKHARALRAVSKEILRGLWVEARRIHQAPVSGQRIAGAQRPPAAGGK